MSSKVLTLLVMSQAALVILHIATDKSEACFSAGCTTKCVISNCWCEDIGTGWTGFLDNPATAGDECASRNASGDKPCNAGEIDYKRYDACNPECSNDFFTPCSLDSGPIGQIYFQATYTGHRACCAE